MTTLVGLLALWACVARPPASAQLLPNAFERELAGGEVHTYTMKLNAGQFLRAVFDQRGVDVVLTVMGADKEQLLRADSPAGAWAPEPLFFEIERAGTYIIEVSPLRASAAPGRYTFNFDERQLAPGDGGRQPAERVFAEATRLLLPKTAQSSRRGIEKYEESLRLFRAAGDRYGELTTLNAIASVSHALGEERRALGYYEEALALVRAAGDRAGEARALGDLAEVYFALGDREKSLDHFGQSLAIYRAAGDGRAAAHTLDRIASVHGAMGETRESLDHLNQALPLFVAARDRHGEAATLNHIGLVYHEVAERRKAREYFERSLAAFRSADECNQIGPVLSNLALDALNANDRQKALDYLEQALTVHRYNHDREGEATTLNNIGFVHGAAGRGQRALAYLQQALAIHREMGNRRGEGDAFSNLMFTWNSLDRPRASVFYGKQAVNAYQEHRAGLAPLDADAQKSFIRDVGLTYRQLAELLITQGRLPEAQQVLGMLKEDEYFEYVRRDGGEAPASARAALTPEEAAQDQKYRQMSEQITARGRLRGELLTKSVRSAEEEKLLSQLDSELNFAGQAFQKFLDQLTEEFASSRQGAEKAYQLKESQGLMEDLRELGAGAVAVYTVVGETKLRVVLITPDVQKAQEYPIKAADLNAKVAAFREALQNPGRDLRPLAQELYRIIVGPIAKDLKDARAETLMWSLDGALRYVPVTALHDGEKYLIERYRNVIFTPASMARLKDQPSPQWKGMGFGVSKAIPGFVGLPAVPEELRGIIREGDAQGAAGGILPGKILIDEAFTEEALRASLRQRYPLVHIASHFQFLPGNETDSFLVMGNGERLSLAQIKTSQNLFGGVELLTLSACNTGSGGVGADGKEVEGFAVLAQRQGAKAVIASLWPVADRSTRLLMEKFYEIRNAPPGTTKAEALQRAQLALLRGELKDTEAGSQRGLSDTLAAGRVREETTYAHPFFWAPFILIGNWR